MKNKILFGLFALIITAAALSSFDWGTEVERGTTEYGEFQTSGTSIYEHTWTRDTITNANNDTLYLPARLRPVNSDFILSYTISRTSISGTANIAVKVEETGYNYTGSTPPTAGWVTSFNNLGAAADTDATTATEEAIRIPNAYGKAYRVIVDGSGTQSTSYVVRLVMKKKS